MSLKRIAFLIGVCLVITSLIFCVRYFVENIEKIPAITWSFTTISAVSIALLGHLLHLILAASGWRAVLSVLGFDVGFNRCVSIFLISQFAKYIPGNFAHHLGRIGLAKEANLPIRITAPSILIELALLVACSVILFISFFPLNKYEIVNYHALGFFLGALWITMPIWLPKAYSHLVPRFIKGWRPASAGTGVNFDNLIQIVLIFPAIFLVLGALMNFCGTAIFCAENHLLAAIGIFAISWLAGFAVPGAPAGIGIRETMLITLLEPLYGVGNALALTISFRIVGTIGDVVGLLLGLLLRKLAK